MGMLRRNMVDYMTTRGYSERTIEIYTTCVNVCARHFMKSPLLLTPEEIESFFLHLKKEKKSDSTIHIYYQSLRFFYRLHDISGMVPRISFNRLNSRLPVVLSQQEVSRLLSACGSLRYRTLFTLIYSAGLRISEAANIRLTDIDFDRRQIFIRCGKNGKDRYTILAERTITQLEAYLQVYNPVTYLFYQKYDNQLRITKDSIHKYFNRAVAECGLSKAVHVHTLRHSFATHLMENGTNLFHIMHLLGHTNIRTTLVYLHMRQPADLNITSPIDLDRFQPPSPLISGPGELSLVPA